MNSNSRALKRAAAATGAGLLACLGLLAGSWGCSKDTGTTVTQDPAQVRREAQEKIAEVQNDPRIPPAQKQAIIGRLQGTAQGGGEAQARSRVPQSGQGQR
jgi:hypothetical protein